MREGVREGVREGGGGSEGGNEGGREEEGDIQCYNGGVCQKKQKQNKTTNCSNPPPQLKK